MDSAHSFSEYIPQGSYNSKFHQIYDNKHLQEKNEKPHLYQFSQHGKECGSDYVNARTMHIKF